MIWLLLLAMVLLPAQALYAQTDMLAPSASHACEHTRMQHTGPAVDGAQLMSCCDQEADRCNQNCRDCFHTQSINAIAGTLVLQINQPCSHYLLPSQDIHSGLSPAGQFRPPRILI